MKLIGHIKEGLHNLHSSKLRSLLALLGILVGTASIVAMVLGGELATNEALKQFKTLGTDLLAVSMRDESDQPNSETEGVLSLQEAMHLTRADQNITFVAPYIQLINALRFGENELSGSILGITEEFKEVVHIEMDRGRFISNLDNVNYYCAIGQGIYDQIKKNSLVDPLGQQIQIGKIFFTIIGLAKTWPENSFVNANVDNSIMIPINTAAMINKLATINNVLMRLTPKSDIDAVKENITAYLKPFYPEDALFFRSSKELIVHMEKQSQILTVFLGLIGSVSLIVGGIGVMNIMLVSIVERQREIGIRRAVGATQLDIRFLFIIEAMMLSLLGGILGAMIGILIAYIIALFWQWEFTLFLLPPLIGFSVSTLTGIFFGYYPAYKASKLDPIEALRSI